MTSLMQRINFFLTTFKLLRLVSCPFEGQMAHVDQKRYCDGI